MSHHGGEHDDFRKAQRPRLLHGHGFCARLREIRKFRQTPEPRFLVRGADLDIWDVLFVFVS